MSVEQSLTGVKFDHGKPRMDLLRPEFTEGVAAALTFGAKKYAANNWAKGIDYSRIISSLERHINAFKRGEDIDPESGLSHLYHAGCNLMFLSCFEEWGREDLDDRFKVQVKKDTAMSKAIDAMTVQYKITFEEVENG